MVDSHTVTFAFFTVCRTVNGLDSLDARRFPRSVCPLAVEDGGVVTVTGEGVFEVDEGVLTANRIEAGIETAESKYS